MPTYAYEPIDISGKAVVISGGTTGIGRTIAMRLLMDGANVLVFGRHQQALDDALNDLRQPGGGQVHGMTADQSKWEDLQRVFQEADQKLGGVDILINNAAIAAGSILDSDFEEWKYTLETNLLGYMACCRLAIDRMQARGDGHIVNIGSMSSVEREPEGNIYVATKAAVLGFSEALRKHVNEKGIKVTLIEPGSVGTDMVLHDTPVEKQREQQEAMKMLKTEDIAEAVYFSLTQPMRCDIVSLQIRPHLQLI